MAGLSDFAEDKVIDLILRNTAWSRTNTYLSLHTADPGDTGANEVSTGTWTTYVRVISTFNAATTSGATNNGVVTWPSVDGAVTITHVCYWDALSAGNCLATVDITDKALGVGSVPYIADAGLTLTAGASISDYMYTRILDHILGTSAYTPVATVYLAVYTTNPTSADSGTEAVDAVAPYARQATAFDASSGGATANTAEETFGVAGAEVGTLTHFGVRDALTTGNLLFFGALTASVLVETGDTYKFAAGDLDIAVA